MQQQETGPPQPQHVASHQSIDATYSASIAFGRAVTITTRPAPNSRTNATKTQTSAARYADGARRIPCLDLLDGLYAINLRNLLLEDALNTVRQRKL
jgi:hypothetical protein